MEEREEMADAKERLAEIYKAYFAEVYKFVYRKVRNKQVAEDITQDVFCAALSRIDRFLAHPEPKWWLMATARNKMFELKRKMKHSDPRSLDEIPEPMAEEHDYEEIELEVAALAIVDEDEWELVKDYYLRGIRIGELAKRYGITENNMRVRLHRIRAKMRKAIKQ